MAMHDIMLHNDRPDAIWAVAPVSSSPAFAHPLMVTPHRLAMPVPPIMPAAIIRIVAMPHHLVMRLIIMPHHLVMSHVVMLHHRAWVRLGQCRRGASGEDERGRHEKDTHMPLLSVQGAERLIRRKDAVKKIRDLAGSGDLDRRDHRHRSVNPAARTGPR